MIFYITVAAVFGLVVSSMVMLILLLLGFTLSFLLLAATGAVWILATANFPEFFPYWGK